MKNKMNRIINSFKEFEKAESFVPEGEERVWGGIRRRKENGKWIYVGKDYPENEETKNFKLENPHTKPIDLKISELPRLAKRIEEWWLFEQHDERNVDKIKKLEAIDLDTLPPIIIHKYDSGYKIIDGWYRSYVALKNDKKIKVYLKDYTLTKDTDFKNQVEYYHEHENQIEIAIGTEEKTILINTFGSVEKALNLCGGLLIPDLNIEKISVEKKRQNIVINFKSDKLEFQRELNPINKTAYNTFIEIKENNKNQGIKMFYNQVKHLIEEDYKYIRCVAFGYGKHNKEYNKETNSIGYYAWPLLGYQMTFEGQISKQPQKKLEQLLKDKGTEEIKEITFLEDLLETSIGRKFWKENGFAFEGQFNLGIGSLSLKILKSFYEKSRKH